MGAVKDGAGRQRPAKGLIAHSDRGSQYASGSYRELLAAWGMRRSMSRKGCCYDHAPSAFGRAHGVMSAQLTGESLFHTLKAEPVHRERFATREAAQRQLFTYLEGYHNRQRLHSALGYRTPEQVAQQAA